MGTTLAALAMVVLGLVSAGEVRADEAAFGRCSAGTTERLRFIEDRLEERRPYAKWWWTGWTGFYGIGTVVESVQAGLENDRGKRADYTVSAVKAAFGTGRLFFYPITAKAGSDAMRAVEPSDESACRERLRVGEELLRTNAHETESRWSWKRHAVNIGLNAVGGVIVGVGYDEPRGWTSMGIGIAVGEAMIFSHPWKADGDLAEYEQKFGPNPDLAPSKVSLEVVPQFGGLALSMRF